MSASTKTDTKAPAILKKVDPAPWKEAPSFSTTEVSAGSRRKYVISSKENSYLVVVVFHHGFVCGQFYRDGLGISRFHRSWRLGQQQPSQLGVGYRQLCFLDWYWPCRNPYFGSFVSSETKMENFDQPGFGSNDGICSSLAQGSFHCFTPGGFGSLGGFSHCQTRTQFGLSSEVLWNGMYSQFRLTQRFQSSFGIWA